MKALVSVLIFAASLSALADDGAKRMTPQIPPAGPPILIPQIPPSACPAGQAVTYTIQCDAGSRKPLDRIWTPTGPGIEICRVSTPYCTPIIGYSPGARPGHEVEDNPGGPLTFVGFGLGRLLGLEQ